VLANDWDDESTDIVNAFNLKAIEVTQFAEKRSAGPLLVRKHASLCKRRTKRIAANTRSTIIRKGDGPANHERLVDRYSLWSGDRMSTRDENIFTTVSH
jgi:hypothetical protein